MGESDKSSVCLLLVSSMVRIRIGRYFDLVVDDIDDLMRLGLFVIIGVSLCVTFLPPGFSLFGMQYFPFGKLQIPITAIVGLIIGIISFSYRGFR
jgi:hypothetical protein